MIIGLPDIVCVTSPRPEGPLYSHGQTILWMMVPPELPAIT